MTPDLPINGRESGQFIQDYFEQMKRVADFKGEHLKRLESLKAPEIITQHTIDSLNRYRAAQIRASRFL